MFSFSSPTTEADSMPAANVGSFDFSSFEQFKADKPGPVDFLGLSIEATQAAVESEHGLFDVLRSNPSTEKLVFRGTKPTTTGKLLIVFQHYEGDTTYSVLADATGVSRNSVEQQFGKVRKLVNEAFRLDIQRSGERVFFANNDDIRSLTSQLVGNLKKLSRQMDNVNSCVTSIEQSGQTALLPADAKYYLEAHRQVKQLEGSDS